MLAFVTEDLVKAHQRDLMDAARRGRRSFLTRRDDEPQDDGDHRQNHGRRRRRQQDGPAGDGSGRKVGLVGHGHRVLASGREDGKGAYVTLGRGC